MSTENPHPQEEHEVEASQSSSLASPVAGDMPDAGSVTEELSNPGSVAAGETEPVTPETAPEVSPPVSAAAPEPTSTEPPVATSPAEASTQDASAGDTGEQSNQNRAVETPETVGSTEMDALMAAAADAQAQEAQSGLPPGVQEATEGAGDVAPPSPVTEDIAVEAATAQAEAAMEQIDSEGGLPAVEAADKPKMKLNPKQDQEVQAIPSIPGHTASSAPVALPTEAEIEAEVSQAISEIAAASLEATPAASGEAVAVPPKEDVDASIEAAIAAAMSSPADETATEVLDPDDLEPGQRLQGVVQSIHGDNVFLDLGMRLSGVASLRQFQKAPPKEGETIEVIFAGIAEEEGLIQTNLPRAATSVTASGGDWSVITPNQIVECTVTKTNKGGLEVKVGGLRGFIPASQVDIGFVENLEVYVGQKLTAKVTEIKPAKKRLVLSRRKILAAEREQLRADLMGELKVDQVRSGVVKTIKDYGAFVDLGGVDGFLPISQMSWIRIEHPTDVVAEGQEIEVKILSIDREKNKISLGMRQLAPNPWRTAEEKYPKGSTVTGRVTKTESFGAFVELEPGIEGLIHISELEHRRVKRVEEVLKVDDMAEVQVLEVDPAKKRISLSMKVLKAKPEPEAKPEEPEVPAYVRTRKGPLKGGKGDQKGGGLFGNPNDFK